jgi:hypothetical protein
MPGINQAPDCVRAHPQQLGGLPDPEMRSHARTIANADS